MDKFIFDNETNFGRLAGEVSGRPFDEEKLMIELSLNIIPKIFRPFLPKEVKNQPLFHKIDRATALEWSDRLKALANAPVILVDGGGDA